MLKKLNEQGLHIPEGIENQVLLAARMVREHYFPNRSKNFPDWILIFAILKILDSRPNATLEEMFQLMTSPAAIESCDLRRQIHASIAECRNHRAEQKWNEAGVFNGTKQLEIEKLGAMSAFFAARSKQICRRRLNVMLFYADFVHYYLYNVSISGARYVRLGNGPMQEFYERTFDSMVSNGLIKLDERAEVQQSAELSELMAAALTILEWTTLHWVFSNVGSMSCTDLGEKVDRESTHRFTRRGDYIAYEYARLFRNLPQPSLT